MTTTGRHDGRQPNELRPVSIQTGVAAYAEGSALIEFGATRVWCTASVEERVPPWLVGKGSGWVTAEYAMLPRATHTRTNRERAVNSGRSQEISRLIGRSLRAAIDLHRLGERTLTIDCDVLQADGGTRTAAITGGYVALALANEHLVRVGALRKSAIVGPVAAVSAGIVRGQALLDLCYAEDSQADVDCNVVMTGGGELIEVQSTAERRGSRREAFDELLDLAVVGITQLLEIQREALARKP